MRSCRLRALTLLAVAPLLGGDGRGGDVISPPPPYSKGESLFGNDPFRAPLILRTPVPPAPGPALAAPATSHSTPPPAPQVDPPAAPPPRPWSPVTTFTGPSHAADDGTSALISSQPVAQPTGVGRVHESTRSTQPQRSPGLVQVEQLVRQAYALGERGMTYSARDRFVAALQVLAQTLDSEQATDRHGRALIQGLQAMEEAQDFERAELALATEAELRRIVAAHRTRVGKELRQLTLAAVQKAYYDAAQENFTVAAGGIPLGSQALTGLGKTYGLMATEPAPLVRNCRACQMVYLQAALNTDSTNFVAANELGVFLARQGYWEAARMWLEHSLAIRPQPQVWSNLAKVHEQLGNPTAAQMARRQAEALAARPETSGAGGKIQWLTPAQFAALPRDMAPPASPRGQPAASAPPRVSQQSKNDRSGIWSWLPWR